MANTTADKLQGVLDSKEAIRTAINNKGVTVETTDPLSSYANKISSISGGGGGTLTIAGQQTITGILSGTVSQFDTVYVEYMNKLSDPSILPSNIGVTVAFSSGWIHTWQ